MWGYHFTGSRDQRDQCQSCNCTAFEVKECCGTAKICLDTKSPMVMQAHVQVLAVRCQTQLQTLYTSKSHKLKVITVFPRCMSAPLCKEKNMSLWSVLHAECIRAQFQNIPRLPGPCWGSCCSLWAFAKGTGNLARQRTDSDSNHLRNVKSLQKCSAHCTALIGRRHKSRKTLLQYVSFS